MLLQAAPMRNKHGKYLLDGNLFEDGLLDRMDQPEGRQCIEMSDALDAFGRYKAQCFLTEDMDDFLILRPRTAPLAI
jgi:hypothetical protein